MIQFTRVHGEKSKFQKYWLLRKLCEKQHSPLTLSIKNKISSLIKKLSEIIGKNLTIFKVDF